MPTQTLSTKHPLLKKTVTFKILDHSELNKAFEYGLVIDFEGLSEVDEIPIQVLMDMIRERHQVDMDIQEMNPLYHIFEVLAFSIVNFERHLETLFSLDDALFSETIKDLYRTAVTLNPSWDFDTFKILRGTEPLGDELEEAATYLPELDYAIAAHIGRFEGLAAADNPGMMFVPACVQDQELDIDTLTDEELLNRILGEATGQGISRASGAEDTESLVVELDPEKVKTLKDKLAETVVGQKHAIEAVYSAVKRAAVGFRDENRPISVLLFAGPTGVGKALSLDTPIPTPSGFTTMRQIKPGDVVYDEMGETCNVTSLSETFTDKRCFEITFDTGDTVVASEDHQWQASDVHSRAKMHDSARLCEGKDGVVDWRDHYSSTFTTTTLDMFNTGVEDKNGRRVFGVPTCRPVKGAPYEGIVDPYLFGYWLGDGCSYSGAITVSHEDAKQFFLNSGVGEISPQKSKVTESCALYTVPMLRRDMLRSKLVEDDSGKLVKRIPDIIKRADFDTRLAVLQGIMDSDGFLSTGKSVGLDMTNKDLLGDVGELVASLGWKARQSTKEIVFNEKDITVFRLQFRPSHPVFRLERKLVRTESDPGQKSRHTIRMVTSIIEVDPVPCRCISVDSPSHLYLFGKSFIPTHNTLLSEETARELFGTTNVGRIDCAQLTKEYDLSKLLGPAPGYLGYPDVRAPMDMEERENWDEEEARKNADPSILWKVSKGMKGGGVLILDEVEKAHYSIQDQFLTLFDEGYVTTSVGNKIDFRNCLVVMTSNIGSRSMDFDKRKGAGTFGFCSPTEARIGAHEASTIDPHYVKKVTTEAAKDWFKPEIMGRISLIVPFTDLNHEELLKVVELEWRKSLKYLSKKIDAKLELGEELRSRIADISKGAGYGARLISRLIEAFVNDQLAEIYLDKVEVLQDESRTVTIEWLRSGEESEVIGVKLDNSTDVTEFHISKTVIATD